MPQNNNNLEPNFYDKMKLYEASESDILKQFKAEIPLIPDHLGSYGDDDKEFALQLEEAAALAKTASAQEIVDDKGYISRQTFMHILNKLVSEAQAKLDSITSDTKVIEESPELEAIALFLEACKQTNEIIKMKRLVGINDNQRKIIALRHLRDAIEDNLEISSWLTQDGPEAEKFLKVEKNQITTTENRNGVEHYRSSI